MENVFKNYCFYRRLYRKNGENCSLRRCFSSALRLSKYERKLRVRKMVDTPMEISTTKNGVTVTVKRLSLREFYDTEWSIHISASTAAEISCKITRYETETAYNLERAIRALRVIDESTVKSLDQRDKIWYD